MKKLNKLFLYSRIARLRFLTGLFLGLTGVFLAVFVTAKPGPGIARTQRQGNIVISSTNPLVPVGFDCSRIGQLGIDKQMNVRAAAIMSACGATPGGDVILLDSPSKATVKKPASFGTSDVDLITGTETSPHVTQSTTFVAGNPDDPNQIVVGYNDTNAAPGCFAGASYSSDGGATFTRLLPSPFCSGHGTNFGDPVTLYNKSAGAFLAIYLATGCGGQGLGAWKSTDGGVTWAVGPCVANVPAGDGDRESGWSDNNPSSPNFGTMYVSYNNFANPGPPISVVRSTDGGATWSAPVDLPIPAGAGLVRNVQITGDLVTGDVYVAGMDENGGNGCASGCGTSRRNIMYLSTDGGATWANTYTGPAFVGPCRSNSGFFCTMYDNPNYWRHQGWGEPAAFNNVVSLVYAQKDGSDPGNVYYIRSTDSGVTFSAPFQLNSNTDPTKAQWEPNLSVSPAGTLFATWYDETPRAATSCQPSSPGTPCYQMHSRKSTDNGVTWLADDTFSDVASPLPTQPDPAANPVYVSDYDYASSNGSAHLSGWVDGRVTIDGASQQDAFFDKELIAPPSSPILVNPDFEIGPFFTDGTVTGWTVSAHVGDNTEGGTTATHSAALSSGGNFQGDTLAQSFSSTSGQMYAVDFDAGIFGKRSGAPLQVRVEIGNIINDLITPPEAGTFDPNGVIFQHYRYTFTANASSTLLKFTSVGLGNASADQVIDTVSVSLLPPPGPTPTPTPTPTPGPAPMLNNPNFEVGPFDSNNTVTGWTVVGNVGDNSEGSTTSSHSAAFSAGANSQGDMLYQDFSTVNGQTYGLDFDAGVFGKRSGAPLQLRVEVLGPGTLVNQVITPPEAGTYDPAQTQFQHYHFTFTASSASTRLQFTSIGLGNGGADQVVDTVSIGVLNASNPTLMNSDFETGPFFTDGTVTGWAVGGSGHVADNMEGATSFSHGAALSSGANSTGDTLAQQFSTVANQMYAVDFDAGIFGKRSGAPLQILVELIGTGTLATQTVTPPEAGTYDPNAVQFQHYHITFTANSANTVLRFTSVGSGNGGADQIVDTVKVTAIP